MSIPETIPQPQIVNELNTIEQWRQKTNAIVNRLNSLYTSANNLEVGNSIYADNLKVGTEQILICGTDGLIKNSGRDFSDLESLLAGSYTGNFTFNGITSITDTTQSTSCTTGAFKVAGGVGIEKNLYVCEDITATGDVTAANFIGDGSQLTNLNVPPGVWQISGNDIYYNTGNVGIGAIPVHNLHVEDSSGCIALIKTTDATTPEIILQNTSASANIKLDGTDLKLVSGTNTFLSGDTTTGYVGIGTSGPSADLHIYNDKASQGAYLKITDGATSPLECGVIFERISSNTDYRLVNTNDGKFKLQKATDASSWTDFLTVDSAGKVGIGMSIPSEALQVVGNITISGDFISTSDVSVKENIQPISDPIQKVKELSGYTFNRVGQTKRSVGLMAQDVEKVLPEAVTENDEGVKSLAYGNLVALLVETVKEQQKQIDELRKNIEK